MKSEERKRWSVGEARMPTGFRLT